MIIVNNIEQNSKEWLQLRLGVITASRAKDFSEESKLAPLPDIKHTQEGKKHCVAWDVDGETRIIEGTNKAKLFTEVRESLPRVYSDARQVYMAELCGEVATGDFPEQVSAKTMAWGNDHEDEARAAFAFETGLTVDEVGFIYKDESKRFGISPDGLIKDEKIGLEIKCPFTTKVFIEFATCDKIKPEYHEQCQFSMWVTGYDGWYFASYDPRVKGQNLYFKLIERDQAYMDKYDKAAEKFLSDMDAMLKKLDLEFGEQW